MYSTILSHYPSGNDPQHRLEHYNCLSMTFGYSSKVRVQHVLLIALWTSASLLVGHSSPLVRAPSEWNAVEFIDLT
jgi:hypothetical protein